MASKGCARAAGEGPHDYYRRLIQQFPEQRGALETIHQQITRMLYQPDAYDSEGLSGLSKRIRLLRFQRFR